MFGNRKKLLRREEVKRDSGANRKKGIAAVFDKISSYFILFLCGILVLSIVRNITKVKNVESIIENKKEDAIKAQKEQDDLKKKLEYAKSQEFIEKQLRDNLGLAKEGEIIVVLPPPEVLRKFAPNHEEETEVLPDPNWKQWLNLFI